MAGKPCPKCSELTFFETPTGRRCSKCGHTMIVPAKQGEGPFTGGKGKKCSNCGENKIFNGICRGCGAKFF